VPAQQAIESGVARNAGADRLELGRKQKVGASLPNGRINGAASGNNGCNSKHKNKLPAHLKPAVYARYYGCGNRVNTLPGRHHPDAPTPGFTTVIGHPMAVWRPREFLGGRVRQNLGHRAILEIEDPSPILVDLEDHAPAIR
jgi:hypothetical protein